MHDPFGISLLSNTSNMKMSIISLFAKREITHNSLYLNNIFYYSKYVQYFTKKNRCIFVTDDYHINELGLGTLDAYSFGLSQ